MQYKDTTLFCTLQRKETVMKKYVRSFGIGIMFASLVLSLVALGTGDLLDAIFFMLNAIFIMIGLHIK